MTINVATSQCQLAATDSIVVSGSSSEGKFSNCIGYEK